MLPYPIKTGASVTAFILICLVHFILAWDIFAQAKWGRDATVSHVLHNWFQDYPILLISLGILIGHVVWPLK